MGIAGLVRTLDLAPHPEGGWFRETWRSPFLMNTSRGPRPVGTSIIYLLGDGAVGRLHRLAWDEVWHWHGGGPLELHTLDEAGARRRVLDAEAPQLAVPAGTWFGETPADPRGWSLAGCTMAPGFDPTDCEMGRRDALLAAHPGAADIICLLTPKGEDP